MLKIFCSIIILTIFGKQTKIDAQNYYSKIGDLTTRNLSPDLNSFFEDESIETAKTPEITLFDTVLNTIVFDWGFAESYLLIKKISSTQFNISAYTNLPLNGVDTDYVRSKILELSVEYLPNGYIHLFVNSKIKFDFEWNENDVIKAIQSYQKYKINPAYTAGAEKVSYEDCGKILMLNYELMYSILIGNRECVKYFLEYPVVFPAMDNLTLKEEYRANFKILRYYGYI